MPRNGKLTDKQRTFVREYLVDLNAAAAAVRSGYSETYAQDAANQLLGNPWVKAEVDKALAKKADKTEIKSEWVLGKIKEIAEKSSSSDGNRLKALELLGKYRALFIDRQSLENPDGTPLFSGEVTVRLVKTDE